MRATTAVLLAGLLAGPPLAARAATPQPGAKPAAKVAPKKKFVIHTVDTGATHHTVLANVHYRLKNGLKVVLLEDKQRPQVRVSVWYHSGSCNEQPGLHGMAHLFEHLMFEGSMHMGQSVLSQDTGGFYHVSFGVFTYLSYAGATGMNGQTTYENTRYFETVPPENLEIALWLESDRMGFLDAFKQKRLDKQRKIVDNELRQRIQTVPYGQADVKLWRSLFPKSHPCHDTPAGSISDLEHVTIKDMRAYYNPAYAPGDAVLVLAGNLPKNTRALVAKYFGTLPARKPMPRIDYPKVHLDHPVSLTVKDKLARVPEVVLAWHSPKVLSQGAAVADLVSLLLTGSPQARLTRALKDQHLVLDVGAGTEDYGFGGIFEINARPRPGVKPAAIVAAIDQALAKLKTPVSKDELARARMRLETERLTDLQGLSSRAHLLQLYAQYTDNPDGFYADLSRYEKVTPADIAAYVTQHLDPQHRVKMIVTPTHPLKVPATASAPKPAAPAPATAKAAAPKQAAAPAAATPAAATAEKEAR